jgi:carboxyl-terminal processing protease
MEGQTEYQVRRRYVSTGGEDPRRRRGGFLPGLLVGILATVIVVGIIFALFGGSTGGSNLSLSAPASGGSGGTAVDAKTVDKLKLLEQYIDYYYYKSDEISKEDMQNGMYKGLVDSLGDVYSCYFTPKEYQSLQQQTTGVYFGIGAYVSKDVESGACVISGVIKDTPAEAAGLMEGDVIYSVEGKEMNGLELEEVVSYIKGDEGTKVHITIYRNGEPIEMELTRARVTSPTVDSEMKENGIGYLQITEFDDVTTAQFEENFASLKEQGMKGLIIDLRSNPGGNVTTVCEIAEKLLPEGLVFYMEDKNGKRTEYPCKGADFDLPLVVLVNEYSASAAEILSGAIKDAGIGKLVGKKTFGKGIVQTVAPLDDGSAIKLTIANYYTRNGNDIHLKGIEPDIEVDMDADAYLENKIDTQLEKAIEVLTEMMNGSN